jgi:hypothetical protein
MTLIVGSTQALWRDIIHEAEATCEILLNEDLECYLVFLLARYTNKPEVLKQIMASELLEGLKLTRNKREIALQDVGDKCLIFSGLFPNMAEKRMVKVSYYVGIGQSAYDTLSKKRNDIYYLLAKQFVSLMDVLQSIRQYSKEFPDLAPLQAYDLWNETSSSRALSVLKRTTNAHPIRTKKIEK